MKVLLVNGSPHEKGCTYTALEEISNTLTEEGIDSEIFWVGNKPVSGCIACGKCGQLGKCVFDDCVNEFAAKLHDADGFIFGSPVYYASASGQLISFMDRLFHSCNKGDLYLKPAACIASARRAGTTATIDELQKYLTISQMPVISSRYWPMVHGSSPADVKKDEEGLQIMRILARNMAWFLNCKKAGEAAGVKMPKWENTLWTNFIK